MRRTTRLAWAFAAFSCGSMAGSARAEEREAGYFAQHVQAPASALELAVENHYSQGVELSARGVRATDLTREGIGFGLTAGYRLSPTMLFGFGARYDQFAPGELMAERNTGHGLVAGPVIVGHFTPSGRVDPWWLAGVGYRMLWIGGEKPGHRELWRGFELARLVFGVDLRLSDRIAFGPLFGADVSMFNWRDVEGVGTEVVRGKRAEIFFEAGLQARFEFDAPSTRPPAVATAQ